MNSMDPKVCHKHSEMWYNTDVSEEHAKAILLDLCHPDDGGILFFIRNVYVSLGRCRNPIKL
jgi:hypothetical protein